MALTEDQIADVAEQSCFYVTPAGLWLRIDYCDMDAGYFQAHDESTFVEYSFTFSEVSEQENPHFEKLVRVEFS